MEKKVPVMGCIILWILLLGKKKNNNTYTQKPTTGNSALNKTKAFEF